MKSILKIVLAIIILTLLTFIIFFSFNSSSIDTYSYDNQLEIDISLLENGDIIFRKGRSFVSQMVLQIDSRSPFSHVGIIMKNEDSVFVIHSVPDEDDDGIDKVKIDDLKTFLLFDRASAISVYRLNNENVQSIKNIAVNYAKEKAIAGIPFDGGFDLSNDERLYCTELIWKAFKKGGIDLIEGNFDQLYTPFGKGPYILPSTLLESKYLYEITSQTLY